MLWVSCFLPVAIQCRKVAQSNTYFKESRHFAWSRLEYCAKQLGDSATVAFCFKSTLEIVYLEHRTVAPFNPFLPFWVELTDSNWPNAKVLSFSSSAVWAAMIPYMTTHWAKLMPLRARKCCIRSVPSSYDPPMALPCYSADSKTLKFISIYTVYILYFFYIYVWLLYKHWFGLI